MPDGALAVAAACLFADGASELTGLESLRHKESDRLQALATEIHRLGASATVAGDTLVIRPGKLAPVIVDPHGDHRIAMALAPIGLAVDDPGVVDKTWPGFWAMLDDLAG
jgi:3-phosphoshikimate 1-carboxyvinyltransferase